MTKIYCDSSLKEACYVIEGEPPCVTPYLEPVTNNVGEYTAMIIALKTALEREFTDVTILSDSQLVVNQVKGEFACRQQHLKPYLEQTRMLQRAVNATIKWVPREENLAGKVLG